MLLGFKSYGFASVCRSDVRLAGTNQTVVPSLEVGQLCSVSVMKWLSVCKNVEWRQSLSHGSVEDSCS